MNDYRNQLSLNRSVNELKRIEQMLRHFPNIDNPQQMTHEHVSLIEESKRLRQLVQEEASSTYQPNPLEHDFELQSNARTIKPLYNRMQKNQSLSVNDRYGTSNNIFNPQPIFGSNTGLGGAEQSKNGQVSREERRRACEALKPNGCGSKTDWFSFLIPNNPEGFNFTQACNNHDRNYATLGMSFENANRQFYDDMISAVKAVAQPNTAIYRGGVDLAKLYYDKVLENGMSSYIDAQKNAYICKFGRNPS